MRVALDGGMRGRSGVGRYVQELASALAALPGVAPVMVGAEGGSGATLRLFSPVRARRLVSGARRAEADLLHIPHFNAPWFPGMPMVVTIHDVAYLDHPEWQRSPLQRAAYRVLMRGAASRSRAILTVSQFSKERICEHLGVAPGKVHVTHLAPSAANPDPAGLRYAGGAPYVLYVGNIRPHKNVPVLIDAFERVRTRLGGELRLLLVGEVQPGYLELLSRLNERVICLGTLPDAAVAALYRAAEVFVFPSRYEGFGLPPLEAMAAGCPVICSSAASLPEVVGNAALTFDPDDVEQLAVQLEQVLTDSALRADLVRRGQVRAAGFSWERTAVQTAEVYRQVLAMEKG